MHKLVLIRFFFVINLILLPCLSFAEDLKHFKIYFLGQKIGSLELSQTTTSDINVILINGEISSSPFKIFNGRFGYKTTFAKENNDLSSLRFESFVDTIFKNRKINFLIENGTLIDVTVSPPREQTKFTNPELVNLKFVDPAYSFMSMLRAPCKNSFIIYDGRRIAEIISMKSASEFECRYRYKIKKGPGHLYPFNFKNFEIVIFFKQKETLERSTMIVKAGSLKLMFE
jgi:hypothetical protein